MVLVALCSIPMATGLFFLWVMMAAVFTPHLRECYTPPLPNAALRLTRRETPMGPTRAQFNFLILVTCTRF
jgi:hypothetical protein